LAIWSGKEEGRGFKLKVRGKDKENLKCYNENLVSKWLESSVDVDMVSEILASAPSFHIRGMLY
jgi:hypothetical protein